MAWPSSSPSNTTSTCCAARPTSTSGSSGVGRPHRPRLAVTLGDPRGIGPEVVAKALALGPLDADITLLESGERGAEPSGALDRTAPRSLLPEDAGRLAAQAVERAVELARAGTVDAVVTGPVHKHA